MFEVEKQQKYWTYFGGFYASDCIMQKLRKALRKMKTKVEVADRKREGKKEKRKGK